jgi:hypothetical protein
LRGGPGCVVAGGRLPGGDLLVEKTGGNADDPINDGATEVRREGSGAASAGDPEDHDGSGRDVAVLVETEAAEESAAYAGGMKFFYDGGPCAVRACDRVDDDFGGWSVSGR